MGSVLSVSRNKRREESNISWGWLTVIALGLFPLILFLIAPKRRQQQQQQNGQTTQKKVKGKPSKKYPYSGWKIVMNISTVLNTIQKISDKIEEQKGKVDQFSFKEDQLETLKHLAKECDLYLIAKVDSDEEAEEIEKLCMKSKLFESGLNKYKLLFCETQIGKTAIARQIEPQIYIDDDVNIIKELHRFIPSLGLISHEENKTFPSVFDLKNVIVSVNITQLLKTLNETLLYQ